jgi:site-specific DNA-methyltransferase (adenine-specific)
MKRRGALHDGERRWQLVRADSFEWLAGLADRSVDAVVTDPPYGIGFRRESWDGRDIRRAEPAVSDGEAFERWTCRWAAECRRVLKPGGHLLAFGAPRTAHRLAAGIEDAGLELRDQLVWLYGCGVPKGRLREGRASTLKPGYEPIVLARAPLAATLTSNEAAWGTGTLGIDDARVADPDGLRRWPSNVALTHAPRCRTGGCAAACPAGALDKARPTARPSRFFYCPKPARTERDAGCQSLPASVMGIYGKGTTKPRRNTHPTVKPVELMRWLIRLVCPPDGCVLDIFAGSGSTGVAALIERRRFLGVERDPGYARIARARLAHQNARITDPRVDGRTVTGTGSGSSRRQAIPTRKEQP